MELEAVVRVTGKAEIGKAAGPDGILAEVYKTDGEYWGKKY